MDPQVIRHLNDRGTVAGEGLRDLFSGAAPSRSRTEQWNDHRFTRYRVTMAVMDRLLRSYHRGYTAPGDAATRPYPSSSPRATAMRRTRSAASGGAATPKRPARRTSTSSPAGTPMHLDDPKVPRPPATMRTVPPV